MAKRVLSAGQCVPDSMSIANFFQRRFDAKVQTADSADEALSMLLNGPFDLVLVNRLFDADGAPGLDLIKAIKQHDGIKKVPMMLVSNHADAQERAIAAGAEMGFGKAELGSDDLVERLTSYLSDEPAQS